MMSSVLAVLCLINFVAAGKGFVAFRLDDIQTDYLELQQRAISDVFKDWNVPYSVGVIAKNFNAGTMANYIRDCVETDGWDFDVVEHGWIHEDFSNITQQGQTKLLQDAAPKIISVVNSPKLTKVTTFIPPFNAINQWTVPALKAAGYKTLAAATFSEPGPYPYDDSVEIFKVPMDASTSDLTVWTRLIPVTPEFVLDQIKNQVHNLGFSSVMMHPGEFANYRDGQMIINEVNETMVSELRRLLKMVNNAGYEFTTLSHMQAARQGKYEDQNEIPTQSTATTTGPKGSATSSSATTGPKGSTTTTTTSTTGRLSTGSSATSGSISTGSPASTGAASTGAASTGAPAGSTGSPAEVTSQVVSTSAVTTVESPGGSPVNQLTTESSQGNKDDVSGSSVATFSVLLVSLCVLSFF